MKQPLNLSVAVNQALCANPQTHVAWASVQYQSALLGGSNAAYLPTVSIGATISGNHDKGSITNIQNYSKESGSIALNYLLYDFGNRDALRDQAAFALLSSKKSYDNILQSVFFGAVQTYYNLFQAQASLDAYKSAESAAKENLEAAETKVKAGVAIPADKLQARAAYAQAILTRAGSEGTLIVAKGNFAAALGLDAQTSLMVTAPSDGHELALPKETLQELINKAKQKRPDLAAVQTDIQTADAALRAARDSGMPTLALTSSINGIDTSTASPTTNSNVGIALSFPIFTGYATTYKVAAAQEQRSIKETIAQSLEKQVTLDVYTAYANLMTASNQEKLIDDLVVSARASYDAAFGRYKAGVGTILDVTSSQVVLSSAQQQKVSALYSLAVARVALAKALGDNELMNNELSKEESR
ncbi:MAG: TolC family protein [Campylobacterales bacterium]|nr:TolC family protein [Campylobacterales bacterium]